MVLSARYLCLRRSSGRVAFTLGLAGAVWLGQCLSARAQTRANVTVDLGTVVVDGCALELLNARRLRGCTARCVCRSATRSMTA